MSASDDLQARISELIDDLLSPNTNDAEEAQGALIGMGAIVLDPLLARLHELDDFGQLCAIEIVTELKEPRAGAWLITRLGGENSVVREWSAQALGDLGVAEAVPDLKKLLSDRKTAGDPPDWTESVSLRIALTQLGARQQIVPSNLREILIEAANLGSVVRDPDLERALDALAAARQVVPFYQRWEPYKDSWASVNGGEGESWELDWTRPWTTLVEDSHRAALAAAARRTVDATFVVNVEWLDASDWVDL